MTSRPPELMIVMPVYNEQDSIRTVIRDWFSELLRVVDNFVMVAIDDGSHDGTLAILRELESEFESKLEVISRENRGHGQSCLQGYRVAAGRNIPFVFQIDSDGQCDPQYFKRFWDLRDRFDVIYGKRTREDGTRRILASLVLRSLLLLRFNANCIDPNVPYRLMRTQACSHALNAIPSDFFLANVALALLLRKSPGIRHGELPIRFRERSGGEPSVPLSKFAEKALQLYRQLKALVDRGAFKSVAK